MSCGKPHELDCRQLLAEVYLLLDNEGDPDHRRKLQQHLDECSPCLEQYGLEEKLKLLLARKCGGDHASSHLRDRVRAAIQHQATLQRAEDGTIEVTQVTTVEVHHHEPS
ncbi:MAG TPA: mycothiol system anti-sigma-R factor [Pseudonocardiaceae bacterium]